VKTLNSAKKHDNNIKRGGSGSAKKHYNSSQLILGKKGAKKLKNAEIKGGWELGAAASGWAMWSSAFSKGV